MDIVVTIMAGGVGTRFWPVSTKTRPKQFLRLVGERTLASGELRASRCSRTERADPRAHE